MAFSLISKICDIPLVFVDLETTGASAMFGHRAIEIGIVRIENGRRVAEYQQLINPQRRISAGVTALTGISQAMVDDQPAFEQLIPTIQPLMQNAAILGHNVHFDLSFLHKEFRRCGLEMNELFGDAPVMDTVRIARRRFGRGGNALQTLARNLGYVPSVAHRALEDAITTAFVFEKLMEPVGGYNCCLCDALAQQGGPMGLMPASPRESLLPLELEEALDLRRPVRMEYLDGRGQRTLRDIRPLHVRRFNGDLILVAHCELRNAQRTFKLDRIVQLHRIEPAAPIEANRECEAPAEPVVSKPVVSVTIENAARQEPRPPMSTDLGQREGVAELGDQG